MLDVEIRDATCRIECGEDTGTGWLVAPNKVLTARHCVLDAIEENVPIFLMFNSQEITGEIKAGILDHDLELDICLLSFEKTNKLTPIQVKETPPIGGSQFFAYGCPVEKLDIGHRLEGSISQVLDAPKLGMDIEIQIDPSLVLNSYKGFSGAALICDGSCIGVIRVAVGNTIGAISIARMGNFLAKHEVLPECKPAKDSITPELASREEFVLEFDTFILAQAGGYIFIEGAHGIGKSTFCQSYIPVDSSIEYFDTYSFTSMKDTSNVVQLAQPQEFFNWLNMQVSFAITRKPGRIEKKDYPDLIKEIERLLERLGKEYTSRGKTGVFFIDGIDALFKYDDDMLSKFIGLLPQQVPAGIALVFVAPSYERLSTRLAAKLRRDACLTMPPLTNIVTRDFCRQELVKNRSAPTTIKLICDRAQGHPLYLRYLIDLVNSGTDDDELSNLPLIEGSIRNYYESLWDHLQGDTEAVNLLAITVRLRWGIPIQQFSEILNQSEQAVLVSTIARIQHLLLDSNETTIYHSSFSDFLVEKTHLRETDIQRRLTEYCENHRNNQYCLLNVIHHGLKSECTGKARIVSLCDQDWVDACVMNGAEPDVLLDDVNEVLSAATELGSLTETIRVLLLLQRLQFRYNVLFAQSADLTANALISIGKSEESLQHAVRYGQLIISIPEALKLAFNLLAANDYLNAMELLSLIETLIDDQLVSAAKDGIPFQSFLGLYDLQLQQFLIKARAGDQTAFIELQKFQFFCMKNMNASCQDEASSKLLKNEMMMYMQAAMMCISGRYLSSEQIGKFYSGAESDFAEPLVYVASYYGDLCASFGVIPDHTLLDLVFADLQKLVSESWDESKKIHLHTADSLISLDVPRSVIELISREHTNELLPIQFVAEDNVSLDESLLHNGMARWRYESLVNPEILCPPLIELSPSGWKDGIDSICRTVAWCDGCARRLKEAADISGLEKVWSILEQNVFDQLEFSLTDRVVWEEAYALPEAVFPQIYQRLVVLVADLYPNRLGSFVSFVDDQFSSQCGLYSEGFRSILAKVLDYVTRLPIDGDIEDQLFSLTERWRDFVLSNLKNRHELVPELLTIVPVFVRLNAAEVATETYQSVLDFSMGPSWYKEDQFGLMISALEASRFDVSMESDAVSHIAGLLDAAGGEMTFQRFVRYAKRDLIGAMCERGDFEKAVSYFIRQTYGPAEQLFEEATQGSMDRVSLLRGARFPGGALDEQDSIWRIMKSAILVSDWPLCWTILEIFQFGDSRHLDNYVEAYALLTKKSIEDRNVTDVMMNRLKLMYESEVETEQRQNFLLSLNRHLPPELKKEIESLTGTSPNPQNTSGEEPHHPPSDSIESEYNDGDGKRKSRDGLLMPGTFGTKESIQDGKDALKNAAKHLMRRNKVQAQNEVLAGIKSIQNGGWPIWGNQVEEVAEGQKLLLQTTKSPSDIVKLYSSRITNERYEERWRIANHLIEWLASYGTNDEQNALIRLSIEHTEIMVGTVDDHIQKYEFLDEPQNGDASSGLIRLILHAVDHPTWLRSEKASDMLLWLLRNHSEYIPLFGPKAFSMESKNHPDVLCGIFEQLSKSDSKQLWEKLASVLDFENISQKCKHVGRLSALLRIAGRAAQRGSDSATNAIAILKDSIHKTIENSDVSQEIDAECPSWAELLSFEWNRLKSGGYANRQLIERATVVMREQCLPFTIENTFEIEQLLAEGVRGDATSPVRWKAKVSFAFQVALLPSMTMKLLSQIEEIFRPYNPSRLDDLRITNFSSPTINWLTSVENGIGRINPISGKHLYLDFYERVWFENSWNSFRLTAYFYESDKPSQPGLASGRFFSTEEPSSRNCSYWDTCANVKAWPVYFGSYTPAIPSSTLIQATGAPISVFIRKYWRSGRLSESRGGGPIHEGCSLALDIDALRLPYGLKLFWIYEINEEPAGMITPN